MKIISTNKKISKGMELNGNVLSGNTYNAREYIKNEWNGKWLPEKKAWEVNTEIVINSINSHNSWFTGYLSVADGVADGVADTTSGYPTGWCEKCHTYCCGDCHRDE